ncbi:MAG: hypothetical protein ACOC7V_13910, partial [Spirochaetota bacterium]
VRSRRVRASRDPQRVAGRRWAYTWLALAGAVASTTLGILIPVEAGMPTGTAFLRVDSLYAAAAGIVIAGVGVRFPRAGGVPVLLVVGALVVLAAWSVRGFLPVRGEVELGTMTVLAVRDEGMTVEVQLDAQDADGVPVVVAVAGRELVVDVELLDLRPAFFLLGAERFVRYLGPDAATGSPRDDASSRGESGFFGGDLEPAPAVPTPPLEWMLRLPTPRLARLERASASAARVNLLRTYRIVVPADGGPRLEVQ